MNIALAQLNYHIGNFSGNLAKMIDAIDDAKKNGADLICFAELAICGYPPRDFLEFDDFIDQVEAGINTLAEQAIGIGVIVGAPVRNPVVEGKDLYNAAFLLVDGNVEAVRHKALLPTYDVFDEYRYFEPATSFESITFKGVKIALTICEDIWNIGNENPLYTTCPMDHLILEKPDIMINISASPFNYDNPASRLHVVQSNVRRYGVPMFYVNHVGAQTELLFDGGSLVVSPDGSIYDEFPSFEESIQYYKVAEVIKGRTFTATPKEKITLIHEALITGIRDYFGKLGFKKAILGLSGGIDSAVVAALAAEALGAENIRVILMPSQFSSNHSVDDARQLAANLSMQYDIIPIESVYDAYAEVLMPHFWATDFNIAEENIQARIRGMLLMAFSNKFGHIVLNTTNKSEMAVGYGTLYGDSCGGLSVIGDLYKREVYELAHYLNRNGEIIPSNIINKAPSAELKPDQKDSDSLPDYDILDQVLYQYIEQQKGPKEIIDMGFEEALVRKVLRLVNINEFKRHQMAPVLRVSPKAFGMGRRMPIVGKYLA